MEHAGFSPDQARTQSTSAKRRGVFGESHEGYIKYMHPAENTMPLPISTIGGHDDTTNNDAATPHSDRGGRAITPSSPSPSYAGDHKKPKPLAGNTINDDPVGSVSSGSGGGGSASGGTGGGGTGTNGRAACSNADDDSAPGVSPSNSGGDTADSGTGGGGEASNGPPIKARLGPDGGNGGAGAGDEAAPIASPGVELCGDEGDDSLPTPAHSTGGRDGVGSDTGSGGLGTNAPPTKSLGGHHGGSAGDAGRAWDGTVPPSGISEVPTRVPKKGNEEDDELGNLPSGAGGGDSAGAGTGGGEEGSKWSCNEEAACDVDPVAAEQARGNSARDGDDLATKPPTGENEGGSTVRGECQTDGKPAADTTDTPAKGEESGSHVGGIEDLTAIGGDGDDVAPPPSPSSDAADQDESACGPFAHKLPHGGDSAGGVSSGGGSSGSASGGTGGGGTGTNGSMSGSFGDEAQAPAATAAACAAWVFTILHVALLQGVALRTTRVTPETGARPMALCG